MGLGMQHWRRELIIVCSHDDLELTLIYFKARSNFAPFGKYRIKSRFKEIFLNNDKRIHMALKLSPGVICPCPVAMYMYEIMKKCIKSEFKESFMTCTSLPY